MDVALLRIRILAAIGSGGLLVVAVPACEGGKTETVASGTDAGNEIQVDVPKQVYTDGGAPVSVPSGTCSRTESVECFAPEGLPRVNQGNVPIDPDAAPPPPPPDPPRDANRCVAPEFVQDGCCNAAVAGPVFDGKACCYRFCTGSCCGRPLVVDDVARIAPAQARKDWGSDAASPPSTLDSAARDAIAAAWIADARLEHASIASFARFTLDLLAFGAPPELVEASQRASIDEIRHARICFAIASRVAGTPVGPGRLALDGVSVSPTLAHAAAAAVREGCVGETLAALFAERGLAGATDPGVRAALEGIARDEAIHAELAWRFVAWACERDAGAYTAVEAAFAAAFAGLPLPPDAPAGTDAGAWRAFGRLGAEDARTLALAAARDVIEPCSRALLARARRPS